MAENDSRSHDGRDPGRRQQRDTPFGFGVPLGRWAGIPVRAHWSVLVALVLFTLLIATVDLPGSRPGAPVAAYWAVGAVTAVAFFLTLLAHEFAHAVVARRHDLAVHRITLWMLGGMTELDGEAPDPRSDALIAGVGPLTSLVIGGLLAVVAMVVGGGSLIVSAIAWLAALNIVLGLFNLLPGAPLDGGRLLRALLWWRGHDRERAAERAASTGRFLGIALLATGLLGALLGSSAGLWSALVGWFILEGSASERYAARAESLRGITVRQAMLTTPQVAPSWWTVDQFAAHLADDLPQQAIFPLVDLDGRFTGVVTLAGLGRVPARDRPATHLGDVAAAGVHVLQTTPTDDLADLLLPLHLRGGIAVVLDQGRPIGVVTEADLARVGQLARFGRQDRRAHHD